jgi:hypothetical protein
VALRVAGDLQPLGGQRVVRCLLLIPSAFADWDKHDLKARADKLCRSCLQKYPRLICVHCQKHFSAFTRSVCICVGRERAKETSS